MAHEIVTSNAAPAHAVMEPVERRAIQLCQPLRNNATDFPEYTLQATVQSYIRAVRQEMTAAKMCRVPNQVVDGQTNRGVIGGDNRTCARADDAVDRDFVSDELLKHAEVACA